MNVSTQRVTRSVLVVAAISATVWVAAGDLSPPGGPITSTMKDLDMVEPRKPVSQCMTLSDSGSYYVTQNLEANFCGGHCIDIQADNVTLDLNGFAVFHTFDCSLNGVNSGSYENITVKNGTVRGFSNHGVAMGGARNALVSEIRSYGNGDHGIVGGHAGTVRNCVTDSNGGYGIDGLNGSVVVNCTARENGLFGIRGNNGAVVTECSAWSNDGGGIQINNGLIKGCSARGNQVVGFDVNTGTIVDSVATATTGDGVRADAALVHGVSSHGSTGAAFLLSGGSSILNSYSSP